LQKPSFASPCGPKESVPSPQSRLESDWQRSPIKVLTKTKSYRLFKLGLAVFVGVGFAWNHARGVEANRIEQAKWTVAFASFGPIHSQLFIADGDGANARPLLPGAGQDFNASISADSQWVVFTSDRDGSADIYRAHLDGTGLEKLVDDPAFDDQAALSPDGNQLVFVSSRSGQAHLWILDLRTRGLRNLTASPGGDFRPAWSPDGKWIAFSSDRESRKPKDNSGFGTIHSTELFLIRPDGSELQRVTHSGAFAGSPAWTPDGNQLVFHEAELVEVNKVTAARRLRGTSQIGTLDLTTKERRVMTSGPGEKFSPQWVSGRGLVYASGGPEGGLESTVGGAGPRGSFESPKWSADGRHMVFHRDVSTDWPPHQTWWSRDPRFKLLRTGIFPSYSPEGDRMLCNDQTAGILHNSILIMNTDGSGRSVLFSNSEKSALGPVFSPNGASIAFAYGRFFQSIFGPAIADIAVIKSDGSGLKLLTDGTGNCAFPSWSPDGRQIVYRVSSPSKGGLFITDLETGMTHALTPESSHDNFPAWSPKGDRIAFTRFSEGDYELYSVKTDGTDLKRLTNQPGNDAHCAWSPDGEWIGFTSARGGFKDESLLHPHNPQPYGDIYVIRADGSEIVQLTDNWAEEGTVGWGPISRVKR